MGSFFGLEIGRRGVMTQQTALNITGHNISNANTEGYARQSADIVTTSPWHAPMLTGGSRIGQLGTGVDVASIDRIRDEFIDTQIRNETQTSGYWNSMQETLDRVEAILNEPSEDGLRGVMDTFWESWQELSLNPESESVRSVVVQRGMAVAEAFNHAYSQLTDLRADTNEQVKIKVEEINSMAKQITDLNGQIMAIVSADKQPNDLMDKRDLLLKQLSEIANIDVTNDKNGMISVQLGDRQLVEGLSCIQLDLEKDNEGMYMPVWSDSRTRAKIDNGTLRGLLDARGRTSLDPQTNQSEYKEIIPDMIDQLNTLAKTLILKTNEVHRGGYSLNNKTGVPDGEDFFTMPGNPDSDTDWAQCMAVSTDIQDEVKNIAAASYRTWNADGIKTNFGGGSNARKIAQLKQSLNTPQYTIKTESLNVDFSSHDPLSFNIDDGDGPVNISIAPPYTFSDMEELAEALQTEMNENEVDINVRCEAGELVFYSTTKDTLKVIDSRSGITGITTDDLQNGGYQLSSNIINNAAGVDASLKILQNYNRGSASSIFGSGKMASALDDPALDVNASIEINIIDVDMTGTVTYAYSSHEYNRNGDYTLQTGTFTLEYGGAAEQTVNLGSASIKISGLDGKTVKDITELKVGDRGILQLTAAQDAAVDYQQLELDYNSNNYPNEISLDFVFDSGVLDNQTAKELNFYTLDNNSKSSLEGSLFNSQVALDTGTMTECNSAVCFYSGLAEGSGLVENATTDDYWRLVTADVGVVSQEAQRMVQNQEVLVAELENKWESVSGVSLDEEMSNMIMYQHAYNAAARFITAIDEGLETIISKMGLAGR